MSINALSNPVIPQYQAEPSVLLIKPSDFNASTESITKDSIYISSDSSTAEATTTYAPNGLAANGLAANGLAANGLAANGLAANGLAANGLAANGLALNGLTANGLEANGFGNGLGNGFGNGLEANGFGNGLGNGFGNGLGNGFGNGLGNGFGNGLEANSLETTDAASAIIGGALGAILEEPQPASPIGPGSIGSLDKPNADTLAMFGNLDIEAELPADAPAQVSGAYLSSAFLEIEAIAEIPLEEITVFKQASNKPSLVWDDYSLSRDQSDGEGGPPDITDNHVAFGGESEELYIPSSTYDQIVI